MQYEPDVFMMQFPIVKRFMYHLIYYRILLASYNKSGLKNEFWTYSIDAHLLQAAILWCMVFGANGCNPAHWKNISKTQSDELTFSFREGILCSAGIDEQQWNLYWADMTDFRNKYAAHRDLGFGNPVPNFDVALQVAYYYDHWIRGVIAPDVFAEPLLKDSKAKLQAEVEPLIKRLLEETEKYFE